MKTLLPFALAVLLGTLFSCKKDNPDPADDNPDTPPADTTTAPPCDTTFFNLVNPDTVFSSDYLMAYPGSSWNYDDGSTEYCDSWTSFDIRTWATFNGCPALTTVQTIVPHTSFGTIHFESSVYNGSTGTTFTRLLCPAAGQFYHHVTYQPNPPNQSSTTYTKTTDVLASMEVGGVTYTDVIHIHSTYSTYFYGGPPGPGGTEDFYYARGVGLIKHREEGAWVETSERNLVSYVIGPH